MHDFINFPELTNYQMQFYYFESPHKQIVHNFNAKVTDVHDGDTIKVKWSERNFEFPIRLVGIAAAELKEKGGKESQSWLENQILGEDVYILINPNKRVGKWGRLLGAIFHRGININEESVRMGKSSTWEERAPLIPDFKKQTEVKKWL